MELKSDDKGEVYLDESNIIDEIDLDDEDLPDIDMDDDDPEDDSVHTFTAHTGKVHVACNPLDATLVATGGADDKDFLWKIGDGDWNAELTGHKDSVSCLALSADGQGSCLHLVVLVQQFESGTRQVVTDTHLKMLLILLKLSLSGSGGIQVVLLPWQVLLIALLRFGMLKMVSSLIHFAVMVNL